MGFVTKVENSTATRQTFQPWAQIVFPWNKFLFFPKKATLKIFPIFSKKIIPFFSTPTSKPFPNKNSYILAHFLTPTWNFCFWKTSLLVENFYGCGKFTFLNAERIIGLIILKTNTSVETIHRAETCLFLWSMKSILCSLEDLSITFNVWQQHIVSFPPPWDEGEMIFVSSARQEGNC